MLIVTKFFHPLFHIRQVFYTQEQQIFKYFQDKCNINIQTKNFFAVAKPKSSLIIDLKYKKQPLLHLQSNVSNSQNA